MAGVGAALTRTSRPGVSVPVSRSLNAARSRAEQRVQRFLDAAFELIDEKGTTEFTIQEVVEQSKQSLRGFYEYFAGKDELLLALFEESIREAGEDINQAVDTQTDPLDASARLHDPTPRVVRPRRSAPQARQPQPTRDLRVLDAPRRQQLARAFEPRSHRSRTCSTSSSTPPPRRARSTSPTPGAPPRSCTRP